MREKDITSRRKASEQRQQNPNTQYCIVVIFIPPYSSTFIQKASLWDWWLFKSFNAIPLHGLVDYLQLFIIIRIILNILNNVIIDIICAVPKHQTSRHKKNSIKTPTPNTALSASSSHHDLLINTPTRVWLRDWWLFESCNAIPFQRLVDYFQLFIIIILNILHNIIIIIIISASFVLFQSIQPPDTKKIKIKNTPTPQHPLHCIHLHSFHHTLNIHRRPLTKRLMVFQSCNAVPFT